ncbi:thiol reductant ABC exporter subunit CydD [Nocardia panacis]|uniref:Thiol reductant ABC exporter subunit CydD n=1 Tax=Nocardia panacis TaxID=2340916 RepID=A0A3A4L794_9NOCA|nr:thiol reductant ABC exporter subunit CydD [Nocardia panacis]RJO78752.1 thiol reductant ABC exporter subunit CydD [Nocardia panacis]
MARPPIDPRLWRHARSARRYLALSVALSVAITGALVVTALELASVLAGVITEPGRRGIGAWTTELAVLAVAIAVRAAATWWQARLAHRAGADVVAELETAALAAAAQLPPRELDTRRTELAVVVGSGLAGLRGYLAGYLPALLLAAIVPPTVMAVIAAHDPISGLITVLTVPLIPIFMILIGLLTKGRAAATLTAATRLSDQLLDLFAGMPTLRALGREMPAAAEDSGRTMAHRVRELGDALRQRTMRALRLAFLSSMVLEMLATLCVALVAVSIGMRLVFGHMSLYAGLVALILAPEVYWPLRTVGERFHAAQDGMAAADKAFAVLEPEASAVEDDSAIEARPDAEEMGGDRVEEAAVQAVSHENPLAPGRFASASDGAIIRLRGLNIAARDGFAPAALTAQLRPGEVTVLAGPNGSGKSTTLQAILGLLTPDRGSVTIDGVDVGALDPQRWWSRVAWLPQRPVLVPGTLRDNLELLGASTDEPRDLESACTATGFDAVLNELPHRWDTVVGQGGLGLSLGQRQRLALARVLAAPRPVLLLDEPTAHLDSASEATVLAALTARARAGATVVVVGHRRSVLAIADHIVRVHATATEAVSA